MTRSAEDLAAESGDEGEGDRHIQLAQSKQGGLTLWAGSPATHRRLPAATRPSATSPVKPRTTTTSVQRRRSNNRLSVDGGPSPLEAVRRLSASNPNLATAGRDEGGIEKGTGSGSPAAVDILLSPADMCMSKITYVSPMPVPAPALHMRAHLSALPAPLSPILISICTCPGGRASLSASLENRKGVWA